MKGAAEYGKRLKHFLGPLKRKMRKSDTADRDRADNEIIEDLLLAILEENAGAGAARSAFKKMMAGMVDYNDLRVTTPRDLARTLDQSIPDAADKSIRIAQVLNHLYDKKNSLNIESLRKGSRRDAREFLNLLDGMTPFVSAMVVHRSLGGHAIPVDEAVRQLLIDQELVSETASLEEIQSFLERHVLAAEAPLFLTEVRKLALVRYKRVRAASARRSASVGRIAKRSSSGGSGARSSGRIAPRRRVSAKHRSEKAGTRIAGGKS